MLRRGLVSVLVVAACAAPAGSELLPIRVFGVADGLAGDQVRALLQDSRGFLWVGTTTGLSRFDGRVFTNFGELDGLPSADVTDVVQARNGTLWVGTSGGLARLRPKSVEPRPFESVQVGNLRRPHTVTALLEDRAERLWVSTTSELLRVSAAGDRRRVEPVSLGPAYTGYGVYDVVEGGAGEVWVGSFGGLFRILPGGRVIHQALWGSGGADSVHGLRWDGTRLWIVFGNGLYIWRPPAADDVGAEYEQPLSHPGRAGVKGLTPDEPLALPQGAGSAVFIDYTGHGQWIGGFFTTRDGRLWIRTERGLATWDGRKVGLLSTQDGLPEAAIAAFLEDRDGDLWIGSESRGLARLGRGGLTGYQVADGLTADRVAAIVEDQAGRLLVQAHGNIFQFGSGRFVDVTPAALRRLDPGWGWKQVFLQDRAGEFWFATLQGLLRLPRAAGLADLRSVPPVALYGPRDGLAGSVFRVWEDRQGDLWIATQNPDGCVLWDRRRAAFRRLGAADGLPNDMPTAFTEDRAGNLWVGFFRGGLARSRDHRHFEFLAARAGIPGGMVFDLLVDRRGALWIASSGGAAVRLSDLGTGHPRSERFGPERGLTSTVVTCLAEDPAGRILLGHPRGVDRLDLETGAVERLTTAEGLTNNVMVTAYRDRAGAVWFGSLHGVSRLAAGAEVRPSPPAALLLGARVGGRPLPVSPLGVTELPPVRLRAFSERFEADFAGVALARPQDLRYEIKLEGLDAAWSRPTVERTVVFSALPSGSYRLLARARFAGAADAGAFAVVPLEVVPPVWRRGWFLALIGLLLLAGAVALHRLRLLRVIEAERVRTRIAADLHDDLGSRLARMSILSELGRRKLASDPAGVGGLLGEIGETARDVMDALSDIVWAVDPRHDDLASLVVRLERDARDLLEPRGVELQVQVPAEARAIPLSPEQRRQLFLLLKEAVHNAARHAQARVVALSIARAGDRLRCEVRDDGVGLPATPADRTSDGGRGRQNMQARARALGSELELESAPGRGTAVRVLLPLA